MLVKIDVGKIMMSLRRIRFRYSCNFHCIKYDSPIISTKGIFKKTHVVDRKRHKRAFNFFNGFTGTRTRKKIYVWNLYHSIELAHTFQKSMSYSPLRYKAVKLYHYTYCTCFQSIFPRFAIIYRSDFVPWDELYKVLAAIHERSEMCTCIVLKAFLVYIYMSKTWFFI